MAEPDQQQFADLFAANYQRIYGFVYALVLDVHEADDVFQQVSLVLWEKFDQFEPGTDFVAWANQIARYKVLDLRKKQSRDRLVFSEELQRELAQAAASLADDDRRAAALKQCIEKLRDEDRQLISRAYGNDEPARAIANDLNRPLTSLHNSLRRIRTALLACIERTLAQEASP
mgnify:CR=1 FL=1